MNRYAAESLTVAPYANVDIISGVMLFIESNGSQLQKS